MFIVENYLLAVIFCLVTMLCWGSWGNTQKLTAKNWRYELFYWDYVIGMLLFSLILGFTMGSWGSAGRPFVDDLRQAAGGSIGWVLLGGAIFNASNILLSASVSLAGLAVAFPLGVGIALVLGVIINYLGVPSGHPVMLFVGVALIVVAIICNGLASGMNSRKGSGSKSNMGMDVSNFRMPAAGMLTPYSAIFIFSVGVVLSNIIFNTLVMRYPFAGKRVTYGDYLQGSLSTHLVGMLGGAIWCLGTAFSYIASGEAGPAVSYALGQGAPMVAAVWGVFVWKEFRGASKGVNWLLGLMFLLFICGLALIVAAGN